MKKIVILCGAVVLFIIGGVYLLPAEQPKSETKITKVHTNEEDIISKSGLHAHPKLEIFVEGESFPVPGNIGVGQQYAKAPTYDAGMKMTAMHTHEADGTIHLEFQDVVTKDDVRLKNLFTIWGKEITSFGTNVTMTVNGEENIELGDYQMRDNDVIVINYKK
jgi:hypothetical protein